MKSYSDYSVPVHKLKILSFLHIVIVDLHIVLTSCLVKLNVLPLWLMLVVFRCEQQVKVKLFLSGQQPLLEGSEWCVGLELHRHSKSRAAVHEQTVVKGLEGDASSVCCCSGMELPSLSGRMKG